MNKVYIFLTIILSVLFTGGYAFATVGGPTFLHEFKYNPLDESIYYILNSQSGRGCPPQLMKLSLNSLKHELVYSCDEGEKLIGSDYSNGYLVNIEINKIIGNFKSLVPINLKDNKIAVDVSFVDYENFSPEIDEIKNANFIASVYQDDKKIIDFPMTGCNIKQPFIFAGYAIPGFEKKIILLLSAKGDCWEGGYIYESLHVVGGVNNLDKTYLSNFYKDPSALVPNEGTLVVFESEEVNNETKEANFIDTSNNNVYVQIFGFILALGLGYFLGRKNRGSRLV